MKVTPEFLKSTIERRKLDRLRAFDRSGKFPFDMREGDLIDAVDELVSDVAGPFIVEVWQHTGRTGKRALSDQVLRFQLQGQGRDEAVNGTGGGGAPTWRELMDLKIELVTRDLEEKLGRKDDDALTKFLPTIERLIIAGKGSMSGTRTAPAAVAAPAADGERAAGADAELRNVLASVALIYRKDRAKFDAYAPHIVSAAQELAPEQPDNDGNDNNA